jgi:hypothetical protein
LAIQFAFEKRIVSIFARADVFNKPLIAKFLHSLAIVPAYRLRTDGEESLVNNIESFKIAGDRLLNGHTVAIFPEATNQDKHWLGEFSLGYLRMAFQTAEQNNFQTDIKVLPMILHYSNYFMMQNDLVVKFGTPISLKDYYELYKTKPRTAQRSVNAEVRRQIDDMMLNINDLENYEAIDYLRNTYGKRYAEYQGKNAQNLPERLMSDKELCAALQKLSEEKPEQMREIYAETLRIEKVTKENGLRDWVLDKPNYPFAIGLKALALLLLSPLYLVALWPHWIIFQAPNLVTPKFEAMGATFKMFIGGVRYLLSALITIPVCYVGVFLIDFPFIGWFWALMHFLILPYLMIFAWFYRKWYIKWRGQWHFIYNVKRDKNLAALQKDRNLLFEKLNELLKVKKNNKN